jgi:hypothetical protein
MSGAQRVSAEARASLVWCTHQVMSTNDGPSSLILSIRSYKFWRPWAVLGGKYSNENLREHHTVGRTKVESVYRIELATVRAADVPCLPLALCCCNLVCDLHDGTKQAKKERVEKKDEVDV